MQFRGSRCVAGLATGNLANRAADGRPLPPGALQSHGSAEMRVPMYRSSLRFLIELHRTALDWFQQNFSREYVMEENDIQPLDSHRASSPSRRYIYRSAEPETSCSHPLRRSTDTPRQFQGIAGEICPQPLMLKFRVYLKLN